MILLNQMNNSIFFFFYNLAHQSAAFDRLVVFTAIYFPVLILISISLYIFYKSDIYQKNNFSLPVFKELMRNGIIIIGPAFIAFVAATVLKEIIHLDRSFTQLETVLPLFNPNQEYSFPSTHTAIFSALAFSIFFINKKIGYIFIFFALLIGLARIVAGVHFPYDILGGFVLGAALAVLARYAFFRFAYFQRKM